MGSYLLDVLARQPAGILGHARRSLVLPIAVTAVMFSLTSDAPASVPSRPRPAAQSGKQEGGLVDRIAAIVNGEVITLTQVERALGLQETDLATVTGTCTQPPGTDLNAESRVLECMIDGLLMFQHVRRFPQFDVLVDDINARYQRLVDEFGSHQAFEDELERVQLTPAEVRYDLERQALIGNYIDLRYRDVVSVSEAAKRRYYDEVLRPEMERQGAPLPEYEAVDDEFIEPILAETEINRRIDEWIADLRRRADITLYLW